MSGLELLGAVSAAATLIDLGRKLSKQLIKWNLVQETYGDAKAHDFHKRVVFLTETIGEVHNILLRLQSQNAKHHRITKEEEGLWKGMKDVIQQCEKKLSELHVRIESVMGNSNSYLGRQKEALKLSAVLPDIRRTQDDINTYIEAIEQFESLLLLISQYRQEALQKTIHHDVRQIGKQQQADMGRIWDKLQEICGRLEPQQTRSERSEELHYEKSAMRSDPNGYDDQVDRLSLNLQNIRLAAENVMTSFAKAESISIASGTTFNSNSALESSSASSNPSETQSLPSISLDPDIEPPLHGIDFDVTHSEPLSRLAQRLQEQAQTDLAQGDLQYAETHQRESIKCFEELHTVHAVPFDAYVPMQETLADILRERKEFHKAGVVLNQLLIQRRYSGTLGCRKVDMNFDEEAKHEARITSAMAKTYIGRFKHTKEHRWLREAEKHAKRAFWLLREILGTSDPEFKQVAKVLAEIYQKDPNKHVYAVTYRELYLSGGDTELTDSTTQDAPLSPPRSRSFTPANLFRAIVSHQPGDVQSVMNMIEEAFVLGVNLDEKTEDRSAMMLAVECPREECERCDLILGALCRARASRDEPFQYAIQIGGPRVISNCAILLDHGAKIDRPDSNLLTPLMNAIRLDNKDLIDFLIIRRGADINIAGERGRTALHLATQKNNPDILKALLKQKAHLLIDAQDIDGLTALHLCAKNDKLRFARWLIRAGADLDIPDRSGVKRTPLWIAANEGKCDFAEMLLESGANLDLAYLPKATGDMRNLLRRAYKERSTRPNG